MKVTTSETCVIEIDRETRIALTKLTGNIPPVDMVKEYELTKEEAQKIVALYDCLPKERL
jgi:hypothetical protein